MGFSKDLSHLSWDEVKRKQLQRFPLVKEWITLLNIARGSTLIDIGSGTGVFVQEYANAIGPEGKVYAIDKSPEALHYLRQEVDESENIVIMFMDAEDSLAILISPDAVTLTDILHHSEFPENILKNVYNIANISTKVLISEFDPDSKGIIGPPLTNRITIETMKTMVRNIGFELIHEGKQNFEHYFLLFAKGS